MFRNPLLDLVVVLPALVFSGALGFFVVAHTVHAEVIPSGPSTMPDRTQDIVVVTRSTLPPEPVTLATITPVSVRTSADLRLYAEDILRDDSYIGALTLSPQEVSVSYLVQGRLFGMVPLAIPTTATVHADGSVTFSSPWYSAVTLGEQDRMKTALEVRMHALLTSEGYFGGMLLAPATQIEMVSIFRELIA